MIRPSRPAGVVHPQSRSARGGAYRHEGGAPAGLGNAGRASRRYDRDHAPAGLARAEQEGGVEVSGGGAARNDAPHPDPETATYDHLRNDRTVATFNLSSFGRTTWPRR